jgi:type I restriction enzyme R subunit
LKKWSAKLEAVSKPTEHKTVQARILDYAEAVHLRQDHGGQVGWTIVNREEAERRRGFDPKLPPADRARNRSLFFDDLLDAKARDLNAGARRT